MYPEFMRRRNYLASGNFNTCEPSISWSGDNFVNFVHLDHPHMYFYSGLSGMQQLQKAVSSFFHAIAENSQ
jgi:hypothetical protein